MLKCPQCNLLYENDGNKEFCKKCGTALVGDEDGIPIEYKRKRVSGKFELLEGNTDEAERILLEVIQKYPKESASYIDLATVYIRTKNYKEASTLLDHAESLIALGEPLYNIDSFCSIDSQKINIAKARGEIHFFQYEYKKAIPYFKKSIEISKEIARKKNIEEDLADIDVLELLGYSYLFEGLYDEAIEVFKRIIINNNIEAETEWGKKAYGRVFHAYVRKGTDIAEKNWKKGFDFLKNTVLKLYPEEAEVYIAMANAIVVDSRGNINEKEAKEALNLLDIAEQLIINGKSNYSTGVYFGNYGISTLYELRGAIYGFIYRQYEEAAFYLKKAIELDNNNIDALAFIGYMACDIGDEDTARESLKVVKSLNPESPYVRELQNNINQTF